MELISREDAMLSVRKLKEVMLTNAEVINALYHVPTIESRPKGKWEDFSCSLCGFTPLIKPMAIDTTKGLIMCTYKYCPSCGAEMEAQK